MKKIIIIILLLIPLKVRGISASSYVVMDMDNNRVLMGENINNKRLIASISKIMTCIIALEKGDLDYKITADEEILKAVGSSIYIEIGETLTLKDLLYGMMLRSGNDAAIMIAKYIGKSEEGFTKIMNDYAKQIGMKNTMFINSNGLENSKGEGNTSTSYDMALLTSYAMKNAKFREIFKTKEYYTKSDKKSYEWHNKNKLLKYDYITGGKTGYTIKAHRTLVTTSNINHMNVVVVTLNDGNDFEDHLEIYREIEKKYQNYDIVSKNENIIFSKPLNFDYNIYLKKDLRITLSDDEKSKVRVEYNLKNVNECTSESNIGNVKIYYENAILSEEEVYINCNKKSKENFFIKIWHRIMKHD